VSSLESELGLDGSEKEALGMMWHGRWPRVESERSSFLPEENERCEMKREGEEKRKQNKSLSFGRRG